VIKNDQSSHMNTRGIELRIAGDQRLTVGA